MDHTKSSCLVRKVQRRPQNLKKNLPRKIWHYWVASNFKWKIFSNYWPSQNTWALPLQCTVVEESGQQVETRTTQYCTHFSMRVEKNEGHRLTKKQWWFGPRHFTSIFTHCLVWHRNKLAELDYAYNKGDIFYNCLMDFLPFSPTSLYIFKQTRAGQKPKQNFVFL